MKENALVLIVILICSILFFSGCSDSIDKSDLENKIVPKQGVWGIYKLDLENEETSLIYSSSYELEGLNVDKSNKYFVFCQKIDGNDNEHREICSLNLDGSGFRRLTNNSYWDLYPVWSPDGTKIAFLSFRDDNLDIYCMDADGSNQELVFDSGFHDADIDWENGKIAFTSNSSICLINENGTSLVQITYPPKQGQWGSANLPFGDYDPRISPDGKEIIFSRLEDDESVHGNYNFFKISINGTGKTRLTNTGYSQGLTSWSYSGERIVFVVSAINDVGKYDIYMMDSDGKNYRNVTPDYFPDDFLCRSVIFSNDDSVLFFIGQWWE
ncbi:MAG: hypothetical protein AYK22_06695 [Thermoplasmatales archaeon SG8-52-3]|nr:MAG: hypothetical protein AYK22_06695 [Thermoplasmatales archaeon SG8-52-3]